jgi:4-hydroxy-tetrahydrodipicolinate synthase
MEKNEIREHMSGIMPPVVTPFDETGEVESKKFRKEIEKMLSLGVSGISVGGSTGEGQTLSDMELKQLIETAVETVNDKVPIIGGIITESTVQAIKKGQILKKLGVSALMVTPIHYLFSTGDTGIYNFYSELKKQTGMPIIVYNVVPWNVASPAILYRMAKEGIIIGVKQSGGDIHALGELLAQAKDLMPIFTAIDDMMFPSFILGSVGAICAINTLLPRTSIRLFEAVKKGNINEALSLHEKIIPIFKTTLNEDMPAKIKFLMNNSGWDVGLARHPLMEPSGEKKEILSNVAIDVKNLEES